MPAGADSRSAPCCARAAAACAIQTSYGSRLQLHERGAQAKAQAPTRAWFRMPSSSSFDLYIHELTVHCFYLCRIYILSLELYVPKGTGSARPRGPAWRKRALLSVSY
ncbi:hypothetical protein EVAR_21370_1 [Eumeta japonica]|uniref:Uncharacterized protein n=1 Tax=Eumeta variegata TaxID=151549 RepID=A0A4C1YEJ6_EUMVA|nr:hypothetical protein EVAR_21370_1 [Eumeta japonica]